MAWPFGGKSTIIGSRDPGAIYLGRYWNAEKKRVEGKLRYGGERHVTILGPNGSGKGACLLIPNLLELEGKSLIVMDPKGQNAAVTAKWRSKVSKVHVLNPFNLLTSTYRDLKSAGFNPLLSLDPDSSTFVDDASGIAEALIRIESKEPHFDQSAQSLVLAFIMHEVMEAKRDKRDPLLENVRMLMMQPDEYERGPDGKSHLVRGLRITAASMCVKDGPIVESLIGRFVRGNDEMASIQSTADTQLRWLLSGPMRKDLRTGTIDFAKLKDEPTTIYVVLPAEYMETHSAWLRLVMTVALRSLYRPGGVPVLFMLDEFAHLGRLRPIETAFGLARGYGVQMMPVLQSLTQLKTLYESNHELFLGQSGAVAGFGPNDWTTAEWMSRRSGVNSIRQPTINASQNPGGANTSEGEGYGRRQYLMEQNLFNLGDGFGNVWMAGYARPIPVYLPPYWDVDTWARRARPDPYHFGKAA